MSTGRELGKFQTGAALLSILLALAVIGCGGGAGREARKLSSFSVLEATKPLDENLVSPDELEPASDAAGVRTLLEFWLTLQHGNYRAATGYFGPTIVNRFGARTIALRLRQLAPLWDSTKPTIVTATAARRTARVYFTVRDLNGKIGSVEIIFSRLGASWKISFFPLLTAAPPG